MEKAMKRPALGRGLGALIPGGSAAERRGVITLGIEEIAPDRAQPRRHFDEAHILELAESIRAKGVLQPLLVRRHGNGYAIVAGERRWRAAQRAGLREVPCLVREVEDLIDLLGRVVDPRHERRNENAARDTGAVELGDSLESSAWVRGVRLRRPPGLLVEGRHR